MNQQVFLSISNIFEVLLVLDISAEMANLTQNPESSSENYYHFKLRKKGGGYREIYAPIPELKMIQKKLSIYLGLCYKSVQPDSVYGYTLSDKNASNPSPIFQNASNHIGKKYVYNMDIEHFFPSITFNHIKAVFLSLPFSFSEPIATFLAQIVVVRNRLPEGSPSSPIISNFVFLPLDKEIATLCDKHNIVYSRYADDITFSSNHKIQTSFITEIKELLGIYHFKINQRKSRCNVKFTRQTVTGLVVNEKVNIKRNYLKNLRGEIFFLEKNTHKITHSEIENIRGKLSFVAQIRGKNDKLFLNLEERFQELMLSFSKTNPKNKCVKFSIKSFSTIDRGKNGKYAHFLSYLNKYTHKNYILDSDTNLEGKKFEIVSVPYITKDTSILNSNRKMVDIAGAQVSIIAVLVKETNIIIGFIQDRIFAYRTKEGIEIPFYKPNTRELNPEFNLAWIGMEGKQVEIQDQLNLLSTLTNGSLVKTTEGRLRFPKDSTTTNLRDIEQLFENPKVASVSVFQRVYEGSDVFYQEWKYNRERKIWEFVGESDQERVDANTLVITYNDGHVSNISVNVSKENQEKNLSRAIEILEDKGSTTKSKVFFTINSDQISQVLLIERSVDNKKAVVKIISGTKGEKTTTSFEWGSWSEFDNLFNEIDILNQKKDFAEGLNLFKTFINAKLKISSDKAQLPLVYKLYTVSFNEESFDKEIAAGKYVIPKMEGKLSVVNVEKADIAVNEGVISKNDLVEVNENPSIEDVSFEETSVETTLDEKIEAFEEKEYSSQEIKDYAKANKENKTDEVRAELQKMRLWAEKNDGKIFTALCNLLNTFPKTPT